MFNKSFSLTGLVILAALIAGVLPAAASDSGLIPAVPVVVGNVMLTETFDSPDAWEQYSSPAGVELGVMQGTYRAYTMNGGFVWGLNDQIHQDVVIEVQTTPMAVDPNMGFGVMCRADVSNNGDGYYFIVNGNGYYTIRIGEGDNVFPLVDWAQSDAVKQGIDTNTLRAVCAGDYLALYANDELIAQVNDATYAEGVAGLAVAAASGSVADVAFDNLTIWEAVPVR